MEMVLLQLLTTSHSLGLVSFSQCWFWPLPFCVESCQGQLLSDALTVSEIIANIVPGDTPLALGADLEVPVLYL